MDEDPIINILWRLLILIIICMLVTIVYYTERNRISYNKKQKFESIVKGVYKHQISYIYDTMKNNSKYIKSLSTHLGIKNIQNYCEYMERKTELDRLKKDLEEKGETTTIARLSGDTYISYQK